MSDEKKKPEDASKAPKGDEKKKPEDASKAPKGEPSALEVKTVPVKLKGDTEARERKMHRAGIFFTGKPRRVFLADLSEAQVAEIEAEPKLKTRRVKV